MAYLAQAGFDAFSMDMTGYGRSTRPAPMNDPCNLSREQQGGFIPALIPAPCSPSYPHQLTTLASDWNDIGAVVDYLLALRHVDRVSLLAWSLGGPRAGGYAAQHPEKIRQMVLLAPAYNRAASAGPPPQVPADGAAMTAQSHDDFTANWARQTGCSDQVDPAASDSVWEQMLASDPVGATWGPGVRRAPQVTTWGWTTAAVAKTQTPTLMVTGVHDKQVPPERVRQLYEDIGAPHKVFVDLGCSSHNAMWEKNHLVLFKASVGVAYQRFRKRHARRHAEARILTVFAHFRPVLSLAWVPLHAGINWYSDLYGLSVSKIRKNIGFAIAWATMAGLPMAVAQNTASTPANAQRALLDKYCVTCHNERAKTGGLVLEKLDLANIPANAEIWEKVIRKLRVGAMPPSGMPKPGAGRRHGISHVTGNVAGQSLRVEPESRPCDAASAEPH